MINRILIVFTLSLLLLACNNETDVNFKREDDSSRQTLEDAGINSSDNFQLVFPELASFFNQSDTSFKHAQFNNSGTLDSMSLGKENAIVKEQIKPYANLLIYNSDSTQAIDLYSYNYIETKKGNNTKWERGEADTEVALIDFRKNTRKRLYFSGPSYAVIDARWMGEDSIAFATAEIIGEGIVKPSFIKFYLKEKQQEVIEYNGTLMAEINNYIEKKMNRVKTTHAF
jgi:uncharacterized protein (DUF1330 family)